MRIMFTTLPLASHLRAMLATARAALQEGHDVVVCAPSSFADGVRAYRLPHLPAGHDWMTGLLQPFAEVTSVSREQLEQLMTHMMVDMFPGEPALTMARDVIGHIHAWRPDIVVRDVCELGGYLAAEACDVPHASVGVVAGSADFLDAHVLAALDKQRCALGLPPDPTGERLYGGLHANLLPPVYDPAEMSVPGTRCYRFALAERPGERLPSWVGDLDPDRPLVLANLGTLAVDFPVYERPLRTLVAGLGDVDCTAVVAVGSGKDPRAYGPAAPNVLLVDHVPQPLLLESCDLLVTHAGFNSVRESLRLGVPMVAVPLIIDNFAIARRCAELGVARELDWETLTAEAVRDACAEVLHEPGYARCARVLQRRILELPPVDRLVADLEALVAATSA